MANELTLLQKDITDNIARKLDELKKDGGLAIPANYNPANALKSAFFEMTNSASGNLLEKCSRESIANSLLNMAIQGLSPAKKQCYFVPYGQNLSMQRSYFGTQKVVKSLTNVEDIWATIIYEGDEFEIEIEGGRERIAKHTTSFLNRDNDIIGAYCIIKKSDGEEVLTVMTRKEIEASWSQSKNKSVQNKFPQEMAKRTVINRAAKAFINTSDDSDALIQAVNDTTEEEFENDQERAVRDVTETVEREANQVLIETKPKAKAKTKPKPEPEDVEVPEDISLPGEIIQAEEIANEMGDLFEEGPGF
ncbi:RecT family recombinase [uncultured Abiotrophia sp.]|uniref:recombinase RecT n=1 Tax=uncultured Abiotrophia sp. TaxID=316094 RepID=UPI0028D6F751|nr:RecT family recombinase [uncultured Abiotrophia sp.]